MTIARLSGQDVTATGSPADGNLSATYPGTPTKGNLLVAALCAENIGGNITAVSSGWLAAIKKQVVWSASLNDLNVSIWYKIAGASEPTTATFNQAGNPSTPMLLALYEYSGIDTNTILDKTASNAGADNTGITSLATGTTGVTVQPDELIFTAIGIVSAGSSAFSWASATALAALSVGDELYAGQRIVSATGAYSDTGSWTTAHEGTAVIATFIGAQVPPQPRHAALNIYRM